jgi:glutathione S-transferase
MAKKLKVVPETTELAEVPGTVDWDSLSEEEKRYESKKMAVYAGMIDAMDHHIGRLITYLKETGQYDNTVFVFISDNGAEGNDAWDTSVDVTPVDKLLLKFWMKNNGYNLDYENLGTRGSYVNIGPSIASAAASPLAFHKFFAHEGGMRVPLIMSGPGITEAGRMSNAFSFVTDIAPTLLDIAGVNNPQNEYRGRTVEPMIGQSILPLAQGKTERIHAADKTIGYELGGNAALFQGDYKIVMDRGPVADGQWHLYNIVTDPGETTDLKEAMPQRFSAMMAAYRKYAADNNVRPVSADYDMKKQLGINMMILQLKSGSPILYIPMAVLILLLGLVAYLVRHLVKRHRNRKWFNRMQPDPPKPGGEERIVARTPENVSSVSDPQAPYSLFKMDISYFSGKLEAYLRYKGIPHIPIEADNEKMEMIYAATGVKKVPAVRTADGKWLFDTTPLIGWFEEKYTEAPVLPLDDPALAFVALLIEDYGDEWLWRPAMWWRWVPRASRWALGWRIAATNIPKAPLRLLGWFLGRRQLKEWLWNDGVTKENSDAVRDMLFREFEFLEPLLEEQPFILGSQPSMADFGYFGSMFRHFGNDPNSAEVMRQQAPNTYEWLARLWNLRIDKCPAEQAWAWPEAVYWGPLLSRIAKDYLPYLHQNALAHQDGKKTFDYRGTTLEFRNTITTTYRVWCREVLQTRYLALGDNDRRRVSALFAPHGGLDALFADGTIASGLADHFRLPLAPKVSGPFKQSLKIKALGQPRN